MKESFLGCEWVTYPSCDHSKAAQISKDYDLSPLLSQVLINRGIKDEPSLKKFLYGSLKDLASPFHLSGIENAVRRIVEAVLSKEKILLHGDYDADGITSLVILNEFFKNIGVESYVFIPDRLKEGHGISLNSLKLAKEKGCSLMITCDVGISASKEILAFNSEKIDVVITDHHIQNGEIPKAMAFFDPFNEGDEDFKHLAGVGVVFFLLVALRSKLRERGFFAGMKEPDLREFLDMVALGTIADVSPLIGENRVLVKCGIPELTNSKRHGIKALKNLAGIGQESELNYHEIAFKLVPRINAAGRMGKAYDAFELLTTDNPNRAEALSKNLDRYNIERKKIESEIISKAKEIVEGVEGFEKKKSFCLAGRNWHRGVLGLVANRLTEYYMKPFAIISIDENGGKGSVRGFKPLNVVEALSECSSYLLEFGGHDMAGGFSIKEESIKDFSLKFVDYVERKLSEEESNTKTILIDGTLDLSDVNDRFIENLKLLEPFGPGNLKPVFLSKSAEIFKSQTVGKDHIKFLFRGGERNFIDAIGFGFKTYVDDKRFPSRADILFTPEINYFNGRRTIQLMLKDMRYVK